MDIFNIQPDRPLTKYKFNYTETNYFGRYCWWNFSCGNTEIEETYIDDLKNVAKCYGYNPDVIDDLVDNGFTAEEIEEYIYCC